MFLFSLISQHWDSSATFSPYLNHYWQRYMLPYGVTRPNWVHSLWLHVASGIIVIKSLCPGAVTYAIIILVNVMIWENMYIIVVHKNSACWNVLNIACCAFLAVYSYHWCLVHHNAYRNQLFKVIHCSKGNCSPKFPWASKVTPNAGVTLAGNIFPSDFTKFHAIPY